MGRLIAFVLVMLLFDLFVFSGNKAHKVSVKMASPVICADPVTDIGRIARVLLETGLTALPVVGEAGNLAGIVSRGDILRAVLSDPPLSLWI